MSMDNEGAGESRVMSWPCFEGTAKQCWELCSEQVPWGDLL